MLSTLKIFFHKQLRNLGYEIIPLKGKPGTLHRPVGKMELFLEDVRARGFTPKYVLDIGANRTLWSQEALRVFNDAIFYLIEPQVEMQSALESFCNQNDSFRYFLAGAGAKPDVLTLTIWDDLQGSSFLPSERTELLTKGTQRKISIITVDELITSKKIAVPDLVKIDIQGFEMEALAGASLTFGKTELFIIETSLYDWQLPNSPLISDVIRFMAERGYCVYDFAGFARRPLDGALGQCDVCFVRKDGLLRASSLWE